MPQEIRAHKFVLVDEAGVSRGVFGFDKYHRPNIELMDPKGNTWGFTPSQTCMATCCPTLPVKHVLARPASNSLVHFHHCVGDLFARVKHQLMRCFGGDMHHIARS